MHRYRWQDRFRKMGLSLTSPRLAVISALSETTEHLSAEDIYLAIRKKHPDETIGLTTVYQLWGFWYKMG